MKAFLLQAVALSALAVIVSAQVPAGPEFRVNTFTTGRQAVPRSAMAPNGDFVVVWESHGQDGDRQGIFGQRFDASGATRGSGFQINTYTTGPQVQVDIAMSRKGGFVVVWASVQDGQGYDIQARRYDASGSPIGGEFAVVPASAISFQSRPQVGMAADGRFVVGWASSDADGSLEGIVARRFDADATALGAPFVVNTYTTGLQISNDLAMGPNGDFVVAWEDFANDRDGSSSTVLGQRFDAAGIASGASSR